jgi:hypothetical protein
LLSAASPVSFLRSIFCALRRPRFARNALARRRRSAALRELAALDKTGFAPSGTGRSLEPDKLMIFVFQRASPNSPRLRRKDVVQAAEGRAESLVERHGSQGKARVCGVLRRMDSNLGGQARRNGKGGTGSCNARGSRKFETAVIRKEVYIISNVYARLANPRRIIRARSSRRVLLASRSHRITLPGS